MTIGNDFYNKDNIQLNDGIKDNDENIKDNDENIKDYDENYSDIFNFENYSHI